MTPGSAAEVGGVAEFEEGGAAGSAYGEEGCSPNQTLRRLEDK